MALFGTAGIRGDTASQVTPELALQVGYAAGIEADGGEFVVARDGRQTGPALMAAMTSGLMSAGARVLTAGQLPTPALAYASSRRRGVMITASHNRPSDNGVKLFRDGVEYKRDSEERIEALVETHEAPVSWQEWGRAERVNPLGQYRTAVGEYAKEIGNGGGNVSVVVDCGNGLASQATPTVLSDLCARVVSLNAAVDGHFPSRQSKPTPESLVDLRTFVADGAFTFGIGHDGDADRTVIVDETGDIVHEDTIVAILAEHYVQTTDVRDPVVVTTPNASTRIDERVLDAGGRTERVRLGALHEGIAAVRATGGTVVFAAEPWKHIHPAFGGWIDGVVSAAVLTRLIATAGGIDPLREPITERPYRKLSFDCPDEHKQPTMDRIAHTLPETYPDADIVSEHGIRANMPDGSWILIRPSGTEPYIRLYAEGANVDTLVEITEEIIADAVRDA